MWGNFRFAEFLSGSSILRLVKLSDFQKIHSRQTRDSYRINPL